MVYPLANKPFFSVYDDHFLRHYTYFYYQLLYYIIVPFASTTTLLNINIYKSTSITTFAAITTMVKNVHKIKSIAKNGQVQSNCFTCAVYQVIENKQNCTFPVKLFKFMAIFSFQCCAIMIVFFCVDIVLNDLKKMQIRTL